MSATTVIENADWIVGFDGSGHRLIRNGSMAWTGNAITFVGRNYQGPRDTVIDGRGRIVMPGLINMHTHLASEAKTKGFSDDHGSRKLWMSGLPEYLPVMGIFDKPDSPLYDRYGITDSLRFALCELVKTGTTSVFDMAFINEDTLRAFEESGLRVFNGPMFRSARWKTPDGHSITYDWEFEAGRRAFKSAVEYVERRNGAWGGRLNGVLIPGGPDTLDPEMIPDIMAASRDLNVPIQIHAAQTVYEHLEMMRRYGQTTVEFLASRGMIGPPVILGHAIYLAHHSIIRYPDHDDIGVLADTGTHVVYCPWNFARRGRKMESFGGYLRRGINMSIGTDTCPHDMVEEMRLAAIVSKIATEDPACPTAAETFSAATLGAAKALGRSDLGRLARGAKADIVVLDARSIAMRPLRDPIKNIVYYGGSRCIETVIVDGRTLVKDGKVLGVNEVELGERIQAAAERALAKVSKRDWAGRAHEEMSPISYALWDPE